MLSANRIRTHTKLYEQKKLQYPYEITMPSYPVSKLSPASYQKHCGDDKFCVIPLDDGVRWMFQSDIELCLFKYWAGISNE